MIKTPPTFGRLLTMVVFSLSCFGLLLYLWLSFGGVIPLKPKSYRFHLAFPEATQLVAQADVRISGVGVGKVVKVSPRGNRTDALIELEARYAPAATDWRAILRTKTLLGETYISLRRGSPDAPKVPDNGTVADSTVAPTVELDEIIGTFKPATRAAFRTWMQSQAAAGAGRGVDVNAAFYELPGFVDEFNNLFRTLDAQKTATREVFAKTGDVFDAISQREGDLVGLIGDSERLFRTTATRNRELAAIFQELPGFARESTRTLPRLTHLAEKARPVVQQLQPAATQLQPTFDALRRLTPELEGLFGQLDGVVSASQKGLPALHTILGQIPSLLQTFEPFLQNANPMLDYLGQHRRELVAFFANTQAATLARDNNLERTQESIHYLRTAQTLSPETLGFLSRALDSTRTNAYPRSGALDKLAGGLDVYDPRACGQGAPSPPATSLPETLVPLVKEFAYRTDGRRVARPGCQDQGALPGLTRFPQIRADP